MKIQRARCIGFCFGVKRAIDILKKVASEHGGVETLGAVVHNQQVLQDLVRLGVKVIESPDDIQGDTLVISAHGADFRIVDELESRHVNVIDATCPFVRRAQIAARRLADSGFFTVVYGEAEHPEVKGILGWAKNRGIATLDAGTVSNLDTLPRRLGILSQTTRIQDQFTEFVKKLIDYAFTKDCELRIIDTICHDTRERQADALELAGKTDLMLVIGDRTSANTNRLVELCSGITQTYLVGVAEEIQPSWLQGQKQIGITAGASTSEQTIYEVLAKLEEVAKVCESQD